MKNNYIVRINRIEINNVKNVVFGAIDFQDSCKDCKSSILGLYGQNGSGKTALIDSLIILKAAISGSSLTNKCLGIINTNFEDCAFNYAFSIIDEIRNIDYSVEYGFDLSKSIEHNIQDSIEKEIPIIKNEKLSFSGITKDIKIKKRTIESVDGEDVLSPKTAFEEIFGNSKKKIMEVSVARRLAYQTSKSFLFSYEFIKMIKDSVNNKTQNDYLFNLYNVIRTLSSYGIHQLFVFDVTQNGEIAFNTLPVSINYAIDENTSVNGKFPIPINTSFKIPADAFNILKASIENMNIVLEQLIPHLKIELINLRPEIDQKGNEVCICQFVSYRNGIKLSLEHESDGIKKIICILQLLIGVYNDESITVAIDELDSGIFEYLLGEILSIIAENGRGQLIFTSHNLRPLETLNKNCIAFTTTNEKNRYIRVKNVKTNNNLRDFYYRNILLDEQEETLYDETNKYEIDLAFKKAGNIYAK